MLSKGDHIMMKRRVWRLRKSRVNMLRSRSWGMNRSRKGTLRKGVNMLRMKVNKLRLRRMLRSWLWTNEWFQQVRRWWRGQ